MPALDALKPSKWPDLNQFTLLHVLVGDNQRYLTWQHWLKAAGIDGLGITIADPHMIAHELANGQLVRVLNVHVDGRLLLARDASRTG